ncbi:hypothetical protein EYF80_025936 [Liparis tanakae]|uniref:Secreted protein n=1 Tax=Liparis tanakae TaxID=230148 RepID=A0A4Z2HDB8_9TELE|nr:hypothetical protein EYF80_025936 [Liparis tanakae]
MTGTFPISFVLAAAAAAAAAASPTPGRSFVVRPQGRFLNVDSCGPEFAVLRNGCSSINREGRSADDSTRS